jgi:hypothetical protein
MCEFDQAPTVAVAELDGDHARLKLEGVKA